MNPIEPKRGAVEPKKGHGLRAATTAVMSAQALAKTAAESKFLVS
jgi:hypothetical protein